MARKPLNITLDPDVMAWVERNAKARGLKRSQFIAYCLSIARQQGVTFDAGVDPDGPERSKTRTARPTMDAAEMGGRLMKVTGQDYMSLSGIKRIELGPVRPVPTPGPAGVAPVYRTLRIEGGADGTSIDLTLIGDEARDLDVHVQESPDGVEVV